MTMAGGKSANASIRTSDTAVSYSEDMRKRPVASVTENERRSDSSRADIEGQSFAQMLHSNSKEWKNNVPETEWIEVQRKNRNRFVGMRGNAITVNLKLLIFRFHCLYIMLTNRLHQLISRNT